MLIGFLLVEKCHLWRAKCCKCCDRPRHPKFHVSLPFSVAGCCVVVIINNIKESELPRTKERLAAGAASLANHAVLYYFFWAAFSSASLRAFSLAISLSTSSGLITSIL